jgi:hypothetical protein
MNQTVHGPITITPWRVRPPPDDHHQSVSEEEQVTTASDVVDLLNKVEVNCYGIMRSLPQLSTVTIKDDTVVLVRPHDPSQFPALVYAIRNSGAGLKPSDDGKQILIPVPTSSRALLPLYGPRLTRSISHSPDRKDTDMTMGDRIKTRQQLLDEQVAAENARASADADRHDKSAHPHQAHDSTVKHVNHKGIEVQGDVDAVRDELAEMRERMAVIKQEVTVEVDRQWISPWRTPAMFDLKVKTRLTGRQEYRSLQDRVRDATASLPPESDAATEAGTGSEASPRTA